MPLYEWKCVKCEKVEDEFRKVSQRNIPKACQCGQTMERVITGYRAIGDLEPYYDDNLESYVKSRKHREKVMREKGVYEYYGKGWR